MSTITVTDALYRISTLLQDNNPQFTRWKERELVMWMNDGQRAIAKYMPFAYSRVDSFKLASGTKQNILNIAAASIIPGDGTAPQAMRGLSLVDVVRNMGVDGRTPGQPIRVIPREIQDNINQYWHTQYGSGMVEHFTYDPRIPHIFYVVPAVNPSINTWIELAYMASPMELPVPSSDTATLYTTGAQYASSTITLDDNYLDDLVNYVCARSYMKDAEYAANQQLAMMYTQLFSQSINVQVQIITGTNPNISFLPFAPSPLSAAR